MLFMQKSIKILGTVLAFLLVTTSYSFAAKKSDEGTNQKLVKVCTLNSAEANQEFQKNVQVMQAQRQRVIQLQSQLDQAQTKVMQKSLKEEIENAMEKLNKDNNQMSETYGFSLNRNYVLVVEKAHVYMAVSEDENLTIQANNKKKKKKEE